MIARLHRTVALPFGPASSPKVNRPASECPYQLPLDPDRAMP